MSKETTESEGVDAGSLGEPAEDSSGPERTLGRRAVILGAAAGVGATAALVAGARPAFAATGENANIQPAQSNPGAAAATATATRGPDAPEPTPFPTGASLTATSSGDGSVGVQGIDGGTTAGGIGVLGTSPDSFGLVGVNGPTETDLPTYIAGVAGISDTNTGVFGQSTTGTSIYGVSAQTSGLEVGSVAAVWGDSEANTGVQGTSATDIGVLGVSETSAGVQGVSVSNIGVVGVSDTGTGVKAESGSGNALEVLGVAIFVRSGVVTIAAGATSATHAGVTLSSTSLVLANLQNSLPGVYVEAVVPTVSGHSFEVFLSAKVPAGKTAKVAWFVVN
jgi:hypothetical protein